ITWRGGFAPNAVIFGGVCFGEGTFIAGGAASGQGKPLLLYSADGAAWGVAAVPEESAGFIRAVAWGNGTFVAGGDDRFLWSDDGIVWEKAAGSPDGLVSIAYGNGVFLAVS